MDRNDGYSAREMIADALIPTHDFLLRAAYLLGKDEVLLRFLPSRRECGEPHPQNGSADVLLLEEHRPR